MNGVLFFTMALAVAIWIVGLLVMVAFAGANREPDGRRQRADVAQLRARAAEARGIPSADRGVARSVADEEASVSVAGAADLVEGDKAMFI